MTDFKKNSNHMNITNFVLSPIDPEVLMDRIAEKVVDKILNNENSSSVPQERLLNVDETAEFLGLSIATVYTKVSRNEIPVMKRGDRLYFSSIELVEWLKEGRKKTLKELNQEADKHILNNLSKGFRI